MTMKITLQKRMILALGGMMHDVVCWHGRCSRSRKACLVGACQACVDETSRAGLAIIRPKACTTAASASAPSCAPASAASRATPSALHRNVSGGTPAHAAASWRAAAATAGTLDDSLRFSTGYADTSMVRTIISRLSSPPVSPPHAKLQFSKIPLALGGGMWHTIFVLPLIGNEKGVNTRQSNRKAMT